MNCFDCGESVPQFLQGLYQSWAKGGEGGQEEVTINGVTVPNYCTDCPAHFTTRSDLAYNDGSYGRSLSFAWGSLNPDIVVVGEEPGPIGASDVTESRTATDYSKVKFRHRCDIMELPTSASNSFALTERLFAHLDSHYDVHFTNAKKCNELPENKLTEGGNDANSTAKVCCQGNNEKPGYLADELVTLDPDLVITLGKQAFDPIKRLCHVDSFPSAQNFSTRIVTGPEERPTRFRDYDVRINGYVKRESTDFSLIPLMHPADRGSQFRIYKENIKFPDNDQKRWYFEQSAKTITDHILSK